MWNWLPVSGRPRAAASSRLGPPPLGGAGRPSAGAPRGPLPPPPPPPPPRGDGGSCRQRGATISRRALSPATSSIQSQGVPTCPCAPAAPPSSGGRSGNWRQSCTSPALRNDDSLCLVAAFSKVSLAERGTRELSASSGAWARLQLSTNLSTSKLCQENVGLTDLAWPREQTGFHRGSTQPTHPAGHSGSCYAGQRPPRRLPSAKPLLTACEHTLAAGGSV